jgi:CNT family concentrative nucleoside transporter
MERFQGLIGVVVLLVIALALSNNRRAISLRIVLWGLALQFGFAFVTLRTELGLKFFQVCDTGINKLLDFSEAGSAFVFRSYVTDKVEAPLINFAFHTLPTVIFFSALLSVLYHLGIMQLVVKGMAWVMVRTMGTSGAETLSVTGDIFVGQTEAPLLIRPFLPGLTKSELMTVMCGGFATIAGGVMAVYVGMLQNTVPGIAGHLMAASVMCAPAAIVIAKIIWPETLEPQTRGTLHVPVERHARNSLEAVAEGATDGMKLSLNIAAMLIAFVAMVTFINAILGWGPTLRVPFTSLEWQVPAVSLQEIFGWLLRPLAWTLGVNWDEARVLGTLLGEKLVMTELVAYSNLGKLRPGVDLSERSAVIASYALCGFANFASIGIQMGGIGALAPDRKQDLAELALRAMIGGALATCMTAAIAGLLI